MGEFWNYNIVFVDGNSLPWLCPTVRTNELLGSDSYYKFIVVSPILNRMDLWWILSFKSHIEKVLYFILPFILCGFTILHLFYLHLHSSNNPLRVNTNNKIPFFPFILVKDFFGLMVVLTLYFLQCHFGIATLSHPDNALEACPLLTPLHIVPEWYFLCQYAMLKAIPNKNAGFIVLLTSVLILYFLGEIVNLTTFTRLMECNNGFGVTFLFLTFLTFLSIGAQFPQEKFLSYARILTVHYYVSIMFIILPKKK